MKKNNKPLKSANLSTDKKIILQLENIYKNYSHNDHQIKILEDINLEIKEGEIVALLGRSGSGKSTILRIIANLVEPSSGKILFYGSPIGEQDPRISMIFQNFGLIPWLTVYENVKLGVNNVILTQEQEKAMILRAINIAGLTGYEEAYPKEISGGMRQRVGFARALVIEPEILLMDEPFSALDYLTANSLKADLLDIWSDQTDPSLKSIIIVTHSVEEAVKLASRIIILSSNPGRVVHNIQVPLKYPREEADEEFHKILDSIYAAMTDSIGNITHTEADISKYPQQISVVTLFHFLLRIREIGKNTVSIKRISSDLKLNNERLVPIINSLVLLGLIKTEKQNISLTQVALELLEADDENQKTIFKNQLLSNVPFIKEIYSSLSSTDATLSKQELLVKLESVMNAELANSVLSATISWARYADLFAYDNVKNELKMDQNFKNT